MMTTELAQRFGITYPIFAFTPSEHVAAAVTRAGGMGVLGCVRFNDMNELDDVLTWMDNNTDGLPYGIDVVMPNRAPTEGALTDLDAMIPQRHRQFVTQTLDALGIPERQPNPDVSTEVGGVLGWLHSVAGEQVNIGLRHRISLIANALGSPPPDVIDQAHAANVFVAALAGTAQHARAHVENGVDLVIAQGTEAGGHTGEISTMVLVPDVVRAVGADVPVLAAGGIGTGQQIAASLALGAQGVWMGSLWLSTEEFAANLSQNSSLGDALVNATSSDTVRTRIYSGKPARLLRSKWTDAWNEHDAPEPLPMPLQNVLVSEAHARIAAAAKSDVIAMPAGQVVGLISAQQPVAALMEQLIEEYSAAVSRLQGYRKH